MTVNSQDLASENNFNFRDESGVTEGGLRALQSNNESQDEIANFTNRHKPQFLQTSD